MTDPFVRHLKSQLGTGRQRLLRRRRTLGAAAALLVVVAVIGGLLATVGRDRGPIEVATRGSETAPPNGSVDPSTVTGSSTTTYPLEPPIDPFKPPIDEWQKSQADETVGSFLRLLTDGADSEAAALLSDYAVVTGGDETAVDAVERFRTENSWLLNYVVLGTTVTPSFSFSDPYPVVTMAGRSIDDEVEHAIAIVVARDVDDDPSTLPLIVRLPAADPETSPPNGSTVARGDTVSLPGLPVEGGATAYIEGSKVPIQIDYEAQETTVVIPDVLPGDYLVLTVSLATPEEPTARAVWFKVDPG